MPQPKATAAIRRVHPPVQITVAKPSRIFQRIGVDAVEGVRLKLSPASMTARRRAGRHRAWSLAGRAEKITRKAWTRNAKGKPQRGGLGGFGRRHAGADFQSRYLIRTCVWR